MREIKKVVWTVIIITLLGISIFRVYQTFFMIYFYYDYAIWCDKEDKDYIKSHSEINSKFNIAVCNINWNTATEKSEVMNGYPSIFAKSVKTNSSAVALYIRENCNSSEVFWKTSLPYIILSILMIILLVRITSPIKEKYK